MQLRTARGRRREVEMTLQKGTATLAAGNTEALGAILSSRICWMREEESEDAARGGELAVRLDPEPPPLSAINAGLASVRARIFSKAQRIMRCIRDSIDIFTVLEKKNAAYLDRLNGETAVSGKGSARLDELEREAETDRTLHQNFLSRSKEINPDLNFDAESVHALSYAPLATVPAFPQPVKLLPAVTLVSRLVWFLAALIVDECGHGIVIEEQAERVLGLPMLGITPLRRRRALDSFFGQEATHDLCARILGTHDGQGPRSIVFTSALPDEGKTTTAVAFARAVAKTGRRVLLVDGDLCRAAASTMLLGGGDSTGLVNVLDGSCRLNELPHHEIQQGLYLIAAGRRTDSPARLLGSSILSDVLERLQIIYDLVVIDTPPVLVGSSASVLACHGAETVLLVRWGSTSLDAVAAACKRLAAAHVNLKGFVLSMVDTRHPAYHGYSDTVMRSSQMRRSYTRSIAAQ